MINNVKTTHFPPTPQIAGVLPNDANIEFIGVRKTQQVIWLRNGSSHYFSDLPVKYFELLQNAYAKDHKAQGFLQEVTSSLPRQIELFTYYMYGDLDTTPDIVNDELSPCENFRHQRDCPSLLWNSKNINIGKHILTPRQLVIIDLMAKDMPDKAIAASLNISPKTLENHKTKLFKAIGVQSKYGLLKASFQHKIVA